MGKRDILYKALMFAKEYHKMQMYDGKPFITHCVLTAQLLEMVTDDREIIATGYLHDILEDTNALYQDLEDTFGLRVAQLVLQCTSTGYNTFPLLKDRDAILVLWASRFANLAHIKSWTEEKQEQYIQKSKFWLP